MPRLSQEFSRQGVGCAGGSAGSAVEGGNDAAHSWGCRHVWIKLAVENKSSWKQLVKPVLTHIGSPALGLAETVQCPDCHKSFLVKGLGAHRARGHNVFRVARTVVDRSGICPVCGLFFHTRRRMIHHIERSCVDIARCVDEGIGR